MYKSSDDNSWKIMAREILKERHIAFIFEGTIPQLKNPNLLTRRNEFMQKGLIYFKDLYKFNTNQFRDRQSLETHFGINITTFDFMCLIQSIPGEIKKIYKGNGNTK